MTESSKTNRERVSAPAPSATDTHPISHEEFAVEEDRKYDMIHSATVSNFTGCNKRVHSSGRQPALAVSWCLSQAVWEQTEQMSSATAD